MLTSWLTLLWGAFPQSLMMVALLVLLLGAFPNTMMTDCWFYSGVLFPLVIILQQVLFLASRSVRGWSDYSIQGAFPCHINISRSAFLLYEVLFLTCAAVHHSMNGCFSQMYTATCTMHR